MPTIGEYGEEVSLDHQTYLGHIGNLYGFYVEDTDLDTNESLDTLVVTGNLPVHITLNLEAFGGQVIAYIYEDTRVSSNGSEIASSRFNRVHSKPCYSRLYSAPSVIDVGTMFVKRRVLSFAQGNNRITSAVSSGTERVLKPFTNYLIRQTAVSDNISVVLTGVFSEH